MRLLLQLIQKMTSSAHDRGTDEWLRDHHLIQVVNLIKVNVEFYDKRSADSGPRNVRGIKNLYPVNAGEVLGKSRGFGRRYVGAISPLIKFDVCWSCNE